MDAAANGGGGTGAGAGAGIGAGDWWAQPKPANTSPRTNAIDADAMSFDVVTDDLRPLSSPAPTTTTTATATATATAATATTGNHSYSHGTSGSSTSTSTSTAKAKAKVKVKVKIREVLDQPVDTPGFGFGYDCIKPQAHKKKQKWKHTRHATRQCFKAKSMFQIQYVMYH